ncbi:hypothetical protein [Streptomyces sp. TRM49041]|uniref:hypothetical protein n=1 Tax=Streptomyces sp. TRM49041 TaxID=2603216 RepID=UPI0021CCFE60|nr:hypothetical protein [Streptomyces sp. TRM49041]
MRGAHAEPITHRTWTDEWVTVRCGTCGRQDQWPQPELGCACGTVLRIPVRPVTAAASPPRSVATGGSAGTKGAVTGGTQSAAAESGGTEPAGAESGSTEAVGAEAGGTEAGGTEPAAADAAESVGGPDAPDNTGRATGREATAATTGVSTVRVPAQAPPPPSTPVARPSFQPVTIRTARDAVAAAALYLRWLGFRNVVQPEDRHTPVSPGAELRGPGLVAQVDPTTRPVSLRAVECLWLEGLASSSTAVFFSLAGYEESARARADGVGLPLFVMDLTGTPQPVNAPADDLVAYGVSGTR